jgi:hypothetical protein
VIDALLVLVAASLGAWCLAIAYSPWMLAACVASVGFLVGALAFRRIGLLVAAASLLALCFLAGILSGAGSRIWEATAYGFGVLAMVETGWDRVRLVPGKLTVRSYARRLAYLARCVAISAAAVLVAATLGYNTVLHWGLSLPFVVAVGLAVVAGGLVAATILSALRRSGGREPAGGQS